MLDTLPPPMSRFIVALVAIVLLQSGLLARANLVITPTWDSTITSDANAATITNTILQALAVYNATFSDNINVSITFAEMTNGLGMSSTAYVTGYSYSSYRTKLVASATTTYDVTALGRLSNTATNPVNGSTTVEFTTANARAIGISASGSPDGTVYLNTGIMNLSRAVTNSAKWDLLSVAEHEINEVLGLSSSLDGLANGNAAPTGDIDSLDFYRFDQNHNRSFNTISNAQAFLSIDGKTQLVQFNQYDGGDFHDWYSWPSGAQVPRVQDAFSLNGKTPDMNVELIALDVIGYHLIIPKMTLTRVNRTQDTISWSPAVPGFILTESTNLASTNWVNSASGTNNPVTITNTTPIVKFYRLNHP